MSLRVLITGGGGLVGSAVLRALVKRDFEILALYRNNKDLSLPNVTWLQCDMEKADTDFFDSLSKVDVVIHNAAQIPVAGVPQNEKSMYIVNFEFSTRLFHWAHSNNVKRVIFTSTYSFLKKPLPEIITEDSEIDPHGMYPTTKWKAESALMDLPSGTTQGIALRLPSPVALTLVNSQKNVVRNWIESARDGKNLTVLGSGSRAMDFVSVDDIAQAFLLAIDADITQNEIFNIGSGNTLSMQDLANQIARGFGVSVEHQGADINADDRWNIDIEKATSVLGYHPKFTSAGAIQALIDNSKK